MSEFWGEMEKYIMSKVIYYFVGSNKQSNDLTFEKSNNQ